MEDNLRWQERKLLDVKMWLWYRLAVEGDRQVRDKLFEAFHLVSLAAVSLEVVEYLTDGEYNDSNSQRFKSVTSPRRHQGFAKESDS